MKLTARALGQIGAAAAALALALASTACSSSSSSPNSGSSPNSSSSPTNSGGASAAPIDIGVVYGATGPAAAGLQQAATVAPAWAAGVNAAGGISGHPVNVTMIDDAGNPATAQANVASAISSHKIVALAVSEDNEIGAYGPATAQDGIPMVGGQTINPVWYQDPGYFPTGPTFDAYVDSLADIAKANHATALASVYCTEVCSEYNSILQAQAVKDGLKFTSIGASLTATDFSSQCLQLKQLAQSTKGIVWPVLSLSSTGNAMLIENCQTQNYNPSTWSMDGTAFGSALLTIPNLKVVGPTVAFPSAATASAAAHFTSTMKRYASGDNWQGGTAETTWQALEVLLTGLKAAKGNFAPQGITAGLDTIKSNNIGGLLSNKITYIAGRPAPSTANCYFLLGIAGGKLSAPDGLTAQCPAS